MTVPRTLEDALLLGARRIGETIVDVKCPFCDHLVVIEWHPEGWIETSGHKHDCGAGGLDVVMALDPATRGEEVWSLPSPLDPLLAGVYRRSLRDRITKPLPPIEWDWHGYIARGQLAYLHSMGGLGKSMLAEALAAKRITGGFLLDRPVRTGRTLYLDAENDDNIIDDRLRRLRVAADATGLVYHRVDTGILGRAQTDGHLEAFLLHLLNEAEADSLILDSWSSLWGKDEIDHVAAQEWFNILNTVRLKGASTILLLGHDNRKGDFRGLAVIHNSIQARLHLKPTHKDDEDKDGPVTDLTIGHYKQRSGALLPKLPFTMTWPPGRREVVISSANPQAGALELIVEHVRAAAPDVVPTRVLAEIANVDRSWINRRDRVEILHACGLERDNEAEPRQSTGWRVQTSPISAQRSTMRDSGVMRETPGIDCEGSTMRDSTLMQDAPPTGVRKTPVGTRLVAE